MVQPIPDNYPTLTPYMIVTDGNAAISFYERAFGARVRLRMGEPGGIVRHAELEIGKKPDHDRRRASRNGSARTESARRLTCKPLFVCRGR